ncbi:uncharacterized protein LOC133711527 [Rosa rugosa]|uniref:uncharacterized protein LOC133711527 n=1 Tax=Rosa rugosa TaxID=74645 RepID=UPI002B40403D|nr:uncharacterized protein LOC133711527 [Rosa rugosa]
MGNQFASSSVGDPYGPVLRALWKAKIPSKVAIFGWRAVQNLLPTHAALSTKGYSGSPPLSIQPSTLSWKDWFLERATSITSEYFDKLLVLMWSIWRYGNDKLWRDRSQTGPGIVASAMAWFEEYSSVHPDFVVWRYKWYYKESVHFIAAFSYRSDSVTSSLHTELLAIKYGLEFLQALNVIKVVIESDCLHAVQAINSLAGDLSELVALISEIKGLVNALGEVTVCFAPRQANMVPS